MEIKNLSWGNPTENDFDLILDFYSGTKINSDRTSSVPSAQYWKNTNNAIAFIAQKIKLQSNSVSIYFEYPTKSAGRNKSSVSDVMIVSDKCKIAIEGKFTEYQKAEYESIKKWFNKSKSENRINVINHWKKIIANYSESIIDEHSQLAYQFLHRTASACFGNPDKAIVLYQLFWDVETKSMLQPFLQELRNYIRLIKPHDNLEYYAHIIKTIQNIRADKENVFQRMKDEEIYKFGKQEILKYETHNDRFNLTTRTSHVVG